MPAPRLTRAGLRIPREENEIELLAGRKKLRLTNLNKVFWPEPGITKRDLLQYYADIAPWLIPHLKDRAMVMKRYPNGASGEFFFMKRAPTPRPNWIRVCPITHASGNVIEFPIVQDMASLLWIVNLGCIDLNPWYGRCDDVHRPDYLNFDLDPVPPAGFDRVLETALRVREGLAAMRIPCYAKTSGSRGLHIYVPIRRAPAQKQVWGFAKELAKRLEARYPDLITAEYRIANRPAGRVLVDYNQNAWGRTLASVYSARPTPHATVSTPVTWEEIERGFRIEDFRLDNLRARLLEVGDLWKSMAAVRGRVDLEHVL
ncbi:MAG TPA: non-homologous end-joining DNA ligase [Bryobacteraceae bacterium]|nr:non-homologous end-joining DNA ligase [Bryobacteraceae bacterium]